MINVRTEKLDSPTTGFASQRFWCPVPERKETSEVWRADENLRVKPGDDSAERL